LFNQQMFLCSGDLSLRHRVTVCINAAVLDGFESDRGAPVIA
jgi:hypothetical protein